MNALTRRVFAVVAVFGLLGPLVPPASAARISTEQALAAEQGPLGRAVVDEYLAREDVERELMALGVDPELARLRAAALSPAEIAELAGRIDDEPAGGDVIGVLGVTFLVLIILEWLGVIDVFNKP